MEAEGWSLAAGLTVRSCSSWNTSRASISAARISAAAPADSWVNLASTEGAVNVQRDRVGQAGGRSQERSTVCVRACVRAFVRACVRLWLDWIEAYYGQPPLCEKRNSLG